MKLLYLSSTPEAERRLLSVEWTQWLCAEKQNVAVTASQQDPTFSKGGRASCHSTTMESWCHFNWTTQGRDPSVPVSELIFACETQYQKLSVFWHLQRRKILRSGVMSDEDLYAHYLIEGSRPDERQREQEETKLGDN